MVPRVRQTTHSDVLEGRDPPETRAGYRGLALSLEPPDFDARWEGRKALFNETRPSAPGPGVRQR